MLSITILKTRKYLFFFCGNERGLDFTMSHVVTKLFKLSQSIKSYKIRMLIKNKIYE